MAAIAGVADLGWTRAAAIDSVLVVEGDTVRRWAGGAEITAHTPLPG